MHLQVYILADIVGKFVHQAKRLLALSQGQFEAIPMHENRNEE